MQHKLATWAESDPNRRFDRLLRLIADREWLAEAARIVLASSGARTPGIDGMDKQRMHAGRAGSPSGRPADEPAEGRLSPEAGQADLYPESQWQVTTTGYTDPDRPHCPARHADGHGAHVDDGFVFLGHRIIRKRGSNGPMSVVTTIPKEKAKAFVRKLTETLSGNHDVGKVDMVDRLNRQLAGWAAFYKFTDFTARTFRRIDHVVFWKLAHWLARKIGHASSP